MTRRPANGARVVSVVPSATETLLAWGVRPVAVTRFCEQPGLPTIGGTKDPDVDAIVALRPDLVVVCDEENRAEDADALAHAGLRVHNVHVRAVEDVAPALSSLAAALGIEVEPLRGPAPVVRSASDRVRAFVPIWRRPWMTMNGDTYGSSLLASIGVDNVFAGEAERYPTTTLDAAAVRRPDVVLAPSEPYPFRARHREELSQVARVALVDGQDLFWWGVRTPSAAARLAAQLG